MAEEFQVPLPEVISGKSNTSNDDHEEKLNSFIDNIFMSTKVDVQNIKNELTEQQFNLAKGSKEKSNTPQSHFKKKLNRKKRRQLGLFTISKHELKYCDMLLLNQLWEEYMIDNLNLNEISKAGWENDPEDARFDNISLKLYRADLHGCLIEVIKSVCPSLVGLKGIVVMETRNMFKIVSQDNVVRSVPKGVCEFQYQINTFIFTFSGKNYQQRTADRSSRKLKSIKLPEL